ncbi:unnamed protein product [Anisakis simplex]|uniref:Uncharacterized protein n=1 Tax=Anisakis simplex TaxID=6269 RepID=A0A0M3J4Z2_ANISI|nr:unnamed protein product [Anisakis simplex]
MSSSRSAASTREYDGALWHIYRICFVELLEGEGNESIIYKTQPLLEPDTCLGSEEVDQVRDHALVSNVETNFGCKFDYIPQLVELNMQVS